jgi:hypothetical protein
MITRASEHSDHDFIAINSVEVGGNPDVIGIGAEESPNPDLSLSERVSALHEQGAFTIAAHPTYCAAMPEDYLDCKDLNGLEVYNAYCEEAYANGVATETWDMLLGEGKRIWGVASDDAHLNTKKRYYSDAGHAWVEIWVPELSQEEILKSLERGSFYSTQGPKFLSLDVTATSITVNCTPVQQIRWRTRGSTGFVDCSGDHGDLRESALPEWFKPRDYVRIELVDPQGLKAWSNPLYFVT